MNFRHFKTNNTPSGSPSLKGYFHSAQMEVEITGAELQFRSRNTFK